MQRLITLASLFTLSVLFSCQKSTTGSSEPIKEDVLTLEISNNDITLSAFDIEEIAATFSWSTGTNYGTGKAINYSLNFAEENGEYDEENAINIGKHTYSINFTVEEFQDIVKEILNIESITEHNLKACITATIPDDDRTQSSEVTFKVKTFLVNIEGTAMGESGKTTMICADETKWVWQAAFVPGDLQVTSTDSEFNLSHTIETEGRYSVILHTDENRLEVAPVEKVYFVCEQSGWQFHEMEEVSEGIYTITFELKHSQFKFGTIREIWHYMYVNKTQDNAPWDSHDAVFVEKLTSDNDKKWLIHNEDMGAVYDIELDTTGEDVKMTMFPYDSYLSMIGSATEGVWSLDAKTPLEKNSATTFTWSGELKAGELKFVYGANPEYGKGRWFMPLEKDTELTTMTDAKIMLVDAEKDDTDYKWQVKEAGRYSISLNQLNKTLTVTKE